jgi:hypothetical protein
MIQYTIRTERNDGYKSVYLIRSRASKWFVSQSFLSHTENIENFSIEERLC